jgi:hypothetical protein
MGVSAEEFARLEKEDPAFRAMLEEAKAAAELSFEEQLGRADELLLDAFLSFLEGGDIRALVRAPTILRYLRRQAPVQATKRQVEQGSCTMAGEEVDGPPGWRKQSSHVEAEPTWAGQNDGAEDWRGRGSLVAADESFGAAIVREDESCASTAVGSLIPALRGVLGESELERSLAEIAATERRLAEPESAPDLTEADWARARDTLASAPAPRASEAEAAAAEERDALVARIDRLLAEPAPVEADDVDLADAIVFTAWGRPWIYQGPLDTYRVERHIEKLRSEHRMAHPDRVTRLGSAEFREAAEALAAPARPP